MGSQFTGPAAERMAAARARQAAIVEAAGGIDAWRAQQAQQQREAAAWRNAEQAQAAVVKAQQELDRARVAATAAVAVAEGRWVVQSANGGVEGYSTPEQAHRGAEWFRQGGIGATISRPYCGHWWDDRLTVADSVCRPCVTPKK